MYLFNKITIHRITINKNFAKGLTKFLIYEKNLKHTLISEGNASKLEMNLVGIQCLYESTAFVRVDDRFT